MVTPDGVHIYQERYMGEADRINIRKVAAILDQASTRILKGESASAVERDLDEASRQLNAIRRNLTLPIAK